MTNEGELKIEVKELKLKLLKFASTKILDGTALHNLNVSVESRIFDMVKLEVSTLIPAENVKTEMHKFEVQYPKDWWQAFKMQYFPALLLDRWPVIFTKKTQLVKFDAYVIYPKLPEVMEGVGEEREVIIKYVDAIRMSETDGSKS